MIGATQNNHNWLRAIPPTMTAGPKLLAGFTDVPVMGIPTKWIITRLSPIDMPANPLGALSLVDPYITSRKMNVRTTSAMNPDVIENPPGEAIP